MAFKGLWFGAHREEATRHLLESDAFECWNASCEGGGYSLLGPYSRIVVPDYTDDRLTTVWLYTDHLPACCLDSLVSTEWEVTLEELIKRYGPPEQIAEFPAEATEWYQTHRWQLPNMSVQLALYPTEDEHEQPSFSVVAGLTNTTCVTQPRPLPNKAMKSDVE